MNKIFKNTYSSSSGNYYWSSTDNGYGFGWNISGKGSVEATTDNYDISSRYSFAHVRCVRAGQ